jgi:hypothetical protein
MKLKNRLIAAVATAALAVPVIAYAAGKVKATGSTVTVNGTATPGNIKWDLTAKNAVTVTDDGTTIKLALDGHKFDSSVPGRRGHTMEYVFHQGDKGGKKEKRTIEVTVTHEALDKAVASKAKSIPATAKFSYGPATPVTIENWSLSDSTAKGTITVSRKALGIDEEICIPIMKICVEDKLTLDAKIDLAK